MKRTLFTFMVAASAVAIASCSKSSEPLQSGSGGSGTGGTSAAKSGGTTGTNGGAGGSGGTTSSGGSKSSGGTTSGGGQSGGTSGSGGSASCSNVTANVTPCGGDVVGTWTVTPSCLKLSGELNMASFGIGCKTATITESLQVTGTWTANANGTYTDKTTTTGEAQITLAASCLEISGTTTNCPSLGAVIKAQGYDTMDCTAATGGGCNCSGTINQSGGIGMLSTDPQVSGSYTTANNTVTTDGGPQYSYCVAGSKMTWTPTTTSPSTTGTIVFQKAGSTGSGGQAGSGGVSTPGNGGNTNAGGQTAKGGAGGVGPATGGTVVRDGGPDVSSGTGGVATGGTTGAGGSTGPRADGPCDIYAAASPATPCVAAYSMSRALSKAYNGPLYQVRSGSSSTNMGTGGTTKDIGLTADGYADTATQDTFCTGSTCTVSILYDQSGNKNDLLRAPAGKAGNGDRTGYNCYESSASKGAVTVGGHKVYSLYMAQFEGYRTPLNVKGKNVPSGKVAQGIYEVVDGTRFGTPCCWDFGNVTPDPNTYADMNTLFFGQAYWGNGAGSAPWFMADFEAGVWAGGSKVGDPGWGALSDAHPSNPNNPSMKGVPLAMGILKTDATKWTLRMADVAKATDLSTAYDGNLPKSISNAGGVVLGVGGDNSNNSYGTFYEGAIVSGMPTSATDLEIMKNVKAMGYTK